MLRPNASAEERILTFKQTLEYALENSPALNSAQKTSEIRELEYKNTIASLLPSLDFSTTQGLLNNIPIAGNGTLLTPNPTSPLYSSLSLGLTEKLYDNGETLIKKGIANLSKELADTQFLKTRDNLMLIVAQTFYEYSLAQVLFDVRKQQKATLEKQFKTLSSQYQQGLKTQIDCLRLKTQLQRAEIDVTQASNSIELIRVKLRKEIGAGLKNNDILQFAPLAVSENSREKMAFPSATPELTNFYDYKLSQIQKDINERTVSFSKRKYWPQVSVGGEVIYSNLNYLNSNTPFSASHQLSWNALLTLQYNFWDWGIRRRDVQISEYNREIQDNSVNQGLLETQAQIKTLMTDLLRIRNTYFLRQELLTLEENNYNNMTDRYREGKVTYLDLISSLNNLLDARLQFYTAHFEALQSLAKYKYFEGSLYETLVI